MSARKARPVAAKRVKSPNAPKPTPSSPVRARPTQRALPSRAVRLWVDVSPGPYGVLHEGADGQPEADSAALAAISRELVFPSLDLTWSLSPEALGTLGAGTDLARIAQVFGRATRAFLTIEIENEGVQVLGLWPNATLSSEQQPAASDRGADVVSGLVPILVPIAGPLGALVKGAGVLFRAAFSSTRSLNVVQVAFQRDSRSFGWCFSRGVKGGGLLEGLHRTTALLSISRVAAAQAGAQLTGVLRAAVDLDGSAENVFIEHRFRLPLAPYAAAREALPAARLREARKAEDLPMLLTLAEAASLLSLGPGDLYQDGAFTAAFADRFLSYVANPGGARAGVLIERDSFVEFVRQSLLVRR